MKEYETVYIANPSLTETQVSQLTDRVKALVEKHQGTFFYARNMGSRKLAYPIAKQTKGIYFCADYAAKGDAVAEIERMFRLSEDVVRFLTVIKADRVDVEARAAEIAARGEDAPRHAAEEADRPETAGKTSVEEKEDQEQQKQEQ
jgi:small subunit ribosomal protein S6